MIFVTGGTGFLGAHLIYKLIKQGKTVIALRRKNSNWVKFDRVLETYSEDPSIFKQKLQWIDGQLEDIDSILQEFSSIDEVFHVAAMVSFHKKDRKELHRVNVLGTRILVNACLRNGIKKLCYVSSIAAIGRSKEAYIDENTLWKEDEKNTFYGISKHLAELEIERGRAEGLNACIVNPGIILGPGEINSGSTKIVKTVMDGLRFYPVGTNGFVDVQDVVRIMILLMDKNIFNERFVLVAENLSYHKLFSLIAKQINTSAPSIKVTPFMAKLYCRWQKIKAMITHSQPLVTPETLRTSMSTFYYSNQKIKKQLGYTFTPLEISISSIVKMIK